MQYFNYTIPSLTPPPELKVLPVLDVTPARGTTTTTSTLRIHDSLAIAEYLAEQHPTKALWPRDPQLRALARVAAATMHSGFSSLRGTYPTNFLSRFSGPGLRALYTETEGVASDVEQLFALWDRVRDASVKRLSELGETDDGFLCGGFSIADAFFWPVLWVSRRSLCYSPVLPILPNLLHEREGKEMHIQPGYWIAAFNETLANLLVVVLAPEVLRSPPDRAD